MHHANDPNAKFISSQFGFTDDVHEIFAEDVMISEKMFSEIGSIALDIAREFDSVPSEDLFTRLLESLRETFYLHARTGDLVLVVKLEDQAHYILIPQGHWTWSERAMPEPSSLVS